ncbi:hypothetical protein APHAL10511_004595 [Amanita phalloides]|nr:hypothetical protein APHAL10511_004595 [Amanita phalloides]
MGGDVRQDTFESSVFSQNPGEEHSTDFHSESSGVAIGLPPQIATLPDYGPSDVVSASIDYQGRPEYRVVHHHHYQQASGYPGAYAMPVQHVHQSQFAYHVFHPPTFPYPGHIPERTSQRSTSYTAPSMYAHQVMPQHAPAGHGTTPFVGGAYTSLQYAPRVSSQGHDYAYSHPGYSHSPPSMYHAQYGPPQYAQRYASPSNAERQATWWYMHTGDAPPHSPFQRRHSYPHPSAGAPTQTTVHATQMQHAASTSRVPTTVTQGTLSSPSLGSSGVGPTTETTEKELTSEKPLTRRSYHPKSPLQRSEWTMWAGNVPSDAAHDEVYRFFQRLRSWHESETSPVVSVFLINRSSCAFINYDTEEHLKEAIEYFNGKPLRPEDPRCLKLVCRVRKKDEELKAGVGAQRGMGIHIKWIKEKNTMRESASSPDLEYAEDRLVRMTSSHSVSSSDEEHRRRPQPKSNSSGSHGSYASTTSSLFSRHFPKRYFILKSLTQHDLDLSLEKGLWATQKHNECILNQAYRTSQEVFLVFGVNKSGEFYGYARMAGPIQSGEQQQVAWEARKADSSARGTPTRRPSLDDPPLLLTPSDPPVVVESPAPASTDEDVSNASMWPIADDGLEKGRDKDALYTQTAPPELGPAYKRLSVKVPPEHYTYEIPRRRQGSYADRSERLEQKVVPEETESEADAKEGKRGDDNEGDDADSLWGEPFKVEWLSTERLPFYRLRHVRNPWNHDREVKVSRDGTELESCVGQRLIEEWHTLATLTEPVAAKGKARRNRGGSD